jgi:LuxR family transcriptional regulator, maltose regulon positive regulatory protein
VLHLRLYGPLRVSVDDRVVIDERFTRRKAKALLVLLYLERERYILRDELIERLWPSRDEPPGDTGRLKQIVHVLRRTLEAGHSRQTGWNYILEHNGSYVFNAQMPYASDLEEVERELRLADADRQRGDAANALLHCDRAFTLRQSVLLPEFRYEAWAAPFVEAEREAYLDALDDAARLHAARREHTRAIELLKRARREDPLRESSILLLMESLWRISEAAEAVRAYSQYRDLLARSLQLEPDPKLTALSRAIRGGRGEAGGRLPAA